MLVLCHTFALDRTNDNREADENQHEDHKAAEEREQIQNDRLRKHGDVGRVHDDVASQDAQEQGVEDKQEERVFVKESQELWEWAGVLRLGEIVHEGDDPPARGCVQCALDAAVIGADAPRLHPPVLPVMAWSAHSILGAGQNVKNMVIYNVSSVLAVAALPMNK